MDTDSRNGTGAVVASDAQVTFVAEDSPLAAEILAQLDVLDPARVATRQGPGAASSRTWRARRSSTRPTRSSAAATGATNWSPWCRRVRPTPRMSA